MSWEVVSGFFVHPVAWLGGAASLIALVGAICLAGWLLSVVYRSLNHKER